MKRRNIVVALCSILALSCVSLGGIAVNSASADTTKFEMKYGASARTVSDESGLRFQAIVDKTTADEVVADTARSFGMVIVPTDYLEGITDNFVPQLETVCVNKEVTLTKIETTNDGEEIVPYLDEDGNYYFNGVIDVSYENTNRDFTGIAYIKTTGDTVTYEYAAFSKAEDGTGAADVANNSRSIAEIASAALNETREEYKVEGDRRAVCVSYVNDALTRAAKAEQGSEVDGLFALNGETSIAPNGETTLSLAQAADLRVEWSNSDDELASLDGGKVTFKEYVGQTTVTASIGTEFVATKAVTATATEGTFKWTANSISTVATGYDQLGTSNEYPAKLTSTTVDGVNAVEVTRGIVNASSTPAITFNNADCFFDLNAGSVISFKVGLSAGFYNDNIYGGVAITYKDAPSPDTSNFSEAEFNEKLYVSATSESTAVTLDYQIATVNNQRQRLYKAVLKETGTTTETIWVDFTLYFPNDTAATLEDLQISFGSYNFQVNNSKTGLCDNTKIYVSDIEVANLAQVNTYAWDTKTMAAVVEAHDGYVNSYPAELSVVTVDGQNALKVKYSETWSANSGTQKTTPGIKFNNSNMLKVQTGSKVSFKLRVSDSWVVGNNSNIYITYDGVTVASGRGSIGDGSEGTLASFASFTTSGSLFTSSTSAAGRDRIIDKSTISVFNVFGNGTAGTHNWITVTVDFTGIQNPSLDGLRIMYGARAGSDYEGLLANQETDRNLWIYISDLTVTNP